VGRTRIIHRTLDAGINFVDTADVYSALTLDHTPGFTLSPMTILLHIPAQADMPVACDMSTAVDTPDQRLAAYGRLFANAMVRRERRESGVLFAFRDDAGIRHTVEDLARREAACCPFLDYRIEIVGDEVIWTTTNPVAGDERAAADATLDAFYALPDHAGSNLAALLGRLADRGVDVVEAGDRRFQWSGSTIG
jgi:hypothetical protein